jgi:hypothetical protein
MTMNLVGQKKLFEVPSSDAQLVSGEDIVYSVSERDSGKASQPTTARSSTTSSLISKIKRGLPDGKPLFTYLINLTEKLDEQYGYSLVPFEILLIITLLIGLCEEQSGML